MLQAATRLVAVCKVLLHEYVEELQIAGRFVTILYKSVMKSIPVDSGALYTHGADQKWTSC